MIAAGPLEDLLAGARPRHHRPHPSKPPPPPPGCVTLLTGVSGPEMKPLHPGPHPKKKGRPAPKARPSTRAIRRRCPDAGARPLRGLGGNPSAARAGPAAMPQRTRAMRCSTRRWAPRSTPPCPSRINVVGNARSLLERSPRPPHRRRRHDPLQTPPPPTGPESRGTRWDFVATSHGAALDHWSPGHATPFHTLTLSRPISNLHLPPPPGDRPLCRDGPVLTCPHAPVDRADAEARRAPHQPARRSSGCFTASADAKVEVFGFRLENHADTGPCPAPPGRPRSCQGAAGHRRSHRRQRLAAQSLGAGPPGRYLSRMPPSRGSGTAACQSRQRFESGFQPVVVATQCRISKRGSTFVRYPIAPPTLCTFQPFSRGISASGRTAHLAPQASGGSCRNRCAPWRAGASAPGPGETPTAPQDRTKPMRRAAGRVEDGDTVQRHHQLVDVDAQNRSSPAQRLRPREVQQRRLQELQPQPDGRLQDRTARHS